MTPRLETAVKLRPFKGTVLTTVSTVTVLTKKASIIHEHTMMISRSSSLVNRLQIQLIYANDAVSSLMLAGLASHRAGRQTPISSTFKPVTSVSPHTLRGTHKHDILALIPLICSAPHAAEGSFKRGELPPPPEVPGGRPV